MTLYLVLGLVVLIVGAIGTIYLTGRKAGSTAQLQAALQKTTEVQNAQLQDSTLPRDAASVVDRLRRHDF